MVQKEKKKGRFRYERENGEERKKGNGELRRFLVSDVSMGRLSRPSKDADRLSPTSESLSAVRVREKMRKKENMRRFQ